MLYKFVILIQNIVDKVHISPYTNNTLQGILTGRSQKQLFTYIGRLNQSSWRTW